MSEGGIGSFSRSVQWQALNVGVQIVIQLAFVRYLGEILTQSEWGLVGVVLGFAGLLEIFAQLGLGPSLIQRKNLTRQQVSAAFWFSLFQGMVFCGLVYFSAPAIANWFEKPDMEPVLRWVAFSFLMASFALVPKSLLIRRMDFRSLFWSSFIAMGLGTGAFGIWAASVGWGVYAYIGALLVQNLLLGINYWSRAKLRVSLVPQIREASSLLRYGATSTVFNFLNYAASKLDLLVLDKFLPPAKDATVGLYERSVYLMNTPVTVLGKLSDSVLFSGMSGVQDEERRLRHIFYSGLYVVTTIVLPGIILLELFMEDVVLVLVGSKLLGVVPYARILVLAILFRSWVKVCDAAVRAVDAIAPACVIKASFCTMVAFSAWLGAGTELSSLCIGMVIATTIQAIAMLFLTYKHIRFEWSILLSLLLPGGRAALAALFGAAPAMLLKGQVHWSIHFLMGSMGIAFAVLAASWLRPQWFRAGDYNLLAEIANRLPACAIKSRWSDETED